MVYLNKKVILLISLTVLILTNAYSQIKVSEFVQQSKSATTDKNALYFVDFWATWCVPCVTAKEYVGVLQKQFPEDFYALSLSEENPLKVEQYLEVHPTNLAIAIDYKGEAFDTYKANVLPKGVLFNAKGDVLWSGHTADLKPQMVAKFLRQEKRKVAISSFFKTIKIKEDNTKDYIPSQAIEVKRYPSSEKDNALHIETNSSFLKLTGTLQSIFSHLSEVYKAQIAINEDGLKDVYQVYFKKPYSQNDNLSNMLIEKMNLKIEQKTAKGKTLQLKIRGSKFWDKNQIDWGANSPKFLIDDSQIQADNVTFKSVAYQLSQTLEMPVIFSEKYKADITLHDWDFHYKFFELMKTDLEDNYGIIVEKKTQDFPIYVVSNK